MSQLQLFIQSFFTYLPSFVPSFVGFLLVAPASLRYWLAVQQTPSCDDAPVSKVSRSDVALMGCVIAAVSLPLILLPILPLFGVFIPGLAIDIFCGIFIGSITFAVLLIAGAREFTSGTFAVHRDATGVPMPHAILEKWSKPKVGSAMLLAAGLTVLSLATGAHVVTLLVSLAGVYAWNNGSHFSKLNLRTILVAFLSILTFFTILLGCVFYFYCPGILLSDASDMIDSSYSTPAMTELANSRLLSWSSWMMPIYWSTFPGILITICYRFDFQNHLTAHPEDQTRVSNILESVPPISRLTGPGVVIPSEIQMPSFSKPYFISALTSWFVVNLAMIVILTGRQRVMPEVTFSAFAMFISIPAMCLSVVIMAIVRGQVRELLDYEEEWFLKEKHADYHDLIDAAEMASLLKEERKSTSEA
ncbi:hypothetical protein SISSUDRAFT_1055459 [Sistotremastrum suecicum HHB10207 ss-3]|uniref:Uncharacterized protein n=1 Tax=Sistotremastrum suecicum HHB10207 ss-3 TaxID=1314776 RepID=A0A165XSI4_9AGAM|nr:hypothetical protein SISSUDRAFT_1055459 [Sistotremastrum suecicum HHB10207 ss-3]